MILAKQKYYVVWSGKKTGIYSSWAECKEQVIGVKGAKYKSYPTKELAEQAFKRGHDISETTSEKTTLSLKGQKDIIEESISVDAACSGNPGDMEYRGVYTKTGKELFHYGPVQNGTNNIGEFLAIVHALAWLKQRDSKLPIYSDSQIALNWVRQKQAKTTIPQTDEYEKVWNLIHRAEHWLRQHSYDNRLLKWETHLWGEIKADFGRK